MKGGGEYMIKKIMRIILGFLGAILGYNMVHIMGLAEELNFSWQHLDRLFTSKQFFGIIIGGVIGFFLISYLMEKMLELLLSFENKIREISWKKIVVGIIGLIIGLIVGTLVNFAFSIPKIPRIGLPFQILINLVFTYSGLSLALTKEEQISNFLLEHNKSIINYNDADEIMSNKILDTSVIID